MFKEYYQKQKEKQIQEIIEMANQKENNYLLLREKLNAYYFYCYKHHLECNEEIFDKNRIQNKSYIIESEPDLLDVDTEKVENVIAHLKEVIENNKNSLVDGISLEEADTLLEYNTQLTRKNLSIDLENANARNDKNVIPENIKNSNLGGLCGLSRFFSLYFLQELGLNITINDAYKFPTINIKGGLHAFGTVKIPIKEGNNVYLKSYLIDASYRQFFSTINCIEGRFYNASPNVDGKVGPDAGYYVCLTEKGRKFAQTLLKRGFIEWTEENAKIYGDGFTCSTRITLQNLTDYHKIKELAGTLYMESVEKIR